MASQIHTICEYQGFYRSRDDDISLDSVEDRERGLFKLPRAQFDELERLALSEQDDEDVLSFMQMGTRKGYGKIIKAKNYVGVIRFKNGTQIEILPKIDLGRNDCDHQKAKEVFLRMLATLMKDDYKTAGLANIDSRRMPLFEIFIRMFTDRVLLLVQRGINGAYTMVSENERFFKGRLLVAQQIRNNLIHRERFYVAYDVFSRNAPENRLIKKTLCQIRGQTSSPQNKRDIEELLSFFFDGIPESHNIKADLQSTSAIRLRNELYDTILIWCEVFLRQEGFTTFTGLHETQTLLFPMEKLFEAYVAKCFSTNAPKGWRITAQRGHKMLFDRADNNYQKAFKLKPDLIMDYHNKSESRDIKVVADTKWKRLTTNNPRRPHYGIAQSDMYQMYAYLKKFGAKRVHLIYPKHSGGDFPKTFKRYGEVSGDVDVCISIFDLSKGLRDAETKNFVQCILDIEWGQ